jgi:hypothetical protein
MVYFVFGLFIFCEIADDDIFDRCQRLRIRISTTNISPKHNLTK